MTKAELEAFKGTLLASSQPITAIIHRSWGQKVIDELYDVVSRGKVLGATDTVLSMSSGDKIVIIRGDEAKLIDKDSIGSVIVDSDVTVSGGGFITLDLKNAQDIRLRCTSSIVNSKTVSLSNAAAAKRFVLFFEITTIAATLTFQSNFKMSSDDPRWDSSTQTWASDYVTGKFKANVWFDGNDWYMDISKANYI